MVSVWSIRRRNIRCQETASVKDFTSDTSKKEITAPKIDTSILTTVLLNGYYFFPGCWFLQTCHNRVSKVVSCFNLETVAACPNFRSQLPLCETSKLTNKKIVSTFREICTVSNNTLYLHDLPASWYSLRNSAPSVLKCSNDHSDRVLLTMSISLLLYTYILYCYIPKGAFREQ